MQELDGHYSLASDGADATTVTLWLRVRPRVRLRGALERILERVLMRGALEDLRRRVEEG